MKPISEHAFVSEQIQRQKKLPPCFYSQFFPRNSEKQVLASSEVGKVFEFTRFHA